MGCTRWDGQDDGPAASVPYRRASSTTTSPIRALEINPNYADAQYNLGALLVRQGKDQEAIVQLAKTLRIKPGHAEAHHDLGVLLTRQGKIQEAIHHYTEAVRAKADYGEAYRNLGIALVSQGREKEAVPHFRKALEINPKDYIAHNNLGAALSRQGKIGEAMDHYTQALQINPISADAHYNLGSLLALQGKDGEAIAHLNESLQINPRDAQGHYQMAAILARQGKTQEAIGHLSEAVEIDPNYGEGHLALGMLYLRMGKKDLALERYQILKPINKNLANIRDAFVLTSPFGNRRSPFTGQGDFHPGIDLAARVGVPVSAPADGRVEFEGRFPLARHVRWWRLGNVVVLHHGDRYITLFAHLKEARVRRGQQVRRGDVIATVGNTGWSTSPHLHYEVYRRGEVDGTPMPLDPRIFILDVDWQDREALPVASRRAPPPAFDPLPSLATGR